MREYIEKQIAFLRERIEDDMKRYRSCQHGIREQALKYFSEEDVEKKTDGKYLHPSSLGDDTVRVGQMIDRTKELKTEIWGKYQALRALCEIKWEMEKYPDMGVEMGDAARAIVSDIKQANRRAADCTLKKDAAIKAHFQGAADAGCGALRALGYTDEQIEEMVK